MSLEVLGGRSGNEQLRTQLFNFEYLFQDFSWYVGSSKALEDKEMSSSPEDFIFEIKLFYTNAVRCLFFFFPLQNANRLYKLWRRWYHLDSLW